MNKLAKKAISLVIAITMLFTVFVFAGCGSLTEHRQAAIQELQEYAYARGNHNFTPENWAAIQEYVENGTGAINSARSIDAIDTVLAEFRELVGAVPSYIRVRYHGFSGSHGFTEPGAPLLGDAFKPNIYTMHSLDEFNKHITDLEYRGINLNRYVFINSNGAFVNESRSVNLRNYLLDNFDYSFFINYYILTFAFHVLVNQRVSVSRINTEGEIYFGLSNTMTGAFYIVSAIVEVPRKFTPLSFSLTIE